ncbi:uncharacterized protein ACBR49_011583 [Aulostomus maculatus]
MCHLVRMASHSSETNMHARNLAIIWAPNLLRSKDIEATGFNGTAAFMEVRIQSIVVEFILTHVPQLFPAEGVSSERRKSLPSPPVMSNQVDTFFKPNPSQPPANFGNISPGGGPLPMRPYHAIIEGTDKRKGSLKGRKWTSIFNIGGRFHDPRRRHKHSAKEKEIPALRPARSMDSLRTSSYSSEGSRHPTQTPPSNMSNFAVPSTNSDAEVGASSGAIGGSEYAVTYRRGTGLVSGGIQGTYTALDPEGVGVTDNNCVQSRSPGVSTKVGRRAAMHITGPTMETVPLLNTSNLALGVLQGGGSDRVIHRSRDKDGGERVDGKEGGEKVERKERKVKEVKKAGEGNIVQQQKATDTEEVVHEDEKTVAGEEKHGEEEEEKEEGEAVEEEGSWKPRGESVSREKRGKSLNSNTCEDDDEDAVEAEDSHEYMEMKGEVLAEAHQEAAQRADECAPAACDVLNSTEEQGDDQELSGYVQDNFEFLDQMDCSVLDHMDHSVSYQLNEFSVEPPNHSDYEYEVMEQTPHQPPEQQTCQKHRPLSVDAHNRHTKSLSLPHMTSPVGGMEESCSEEEVEVDGIHEDSYSSDEDESLFVKSLPPDFFLNHLGGPDTDEEDNCAPDESQNSMTEEMESLDPEFSVREQPNTGEEHQEEEEGEDGPEREELEEEERHAAEQAGVQADTASAQSDDPEEDLRIAEAEDVKVLPPETPTRCCEEFLESEDESSAVADVQDETEEDEADRGEPPCHAVSGDSPKKPADVPVEEEELSLTEECSSLDKSEGKDGKTDKDTDKCQEKEYRTAEVAIETNDSSQEAVTETGSEGHKDKMEEEQEDTLCSKSSNIWEEIEELICEVIEDEEAEKNGEGSRGDEEQRGDLGEAAVKVEEEEMEQTTDTHSELQREEEETDRPKRADSAEERQAVDEEAQDYDAEGVVLPEQQEDTCRGERQLTQRAGGKDRKTVTLDLNESKEGWKNEESSRRGVGRKLVISKQPPVKLYRVKAVPVVPPKPQHCKITALTLRQQQQQQQWEWRDADRGRETMEHERVCVGEQGTEVEDEGLAKKERTGIKIRERERRRDGDEGTSRETARNSPLSMCFDEAVAIATMRREKEKECEKERHRVGEVQ